MRCLLPLLLAAGCLLEDLDGDGVPSGADCNDADPAQGRPVPLFVDGDGDGFGGEQRESGCPGNAWLVADRSDCDDDDPGIHPAALEVGCDGRDNDCDASTPDGPAVTVGQTWPTVQAAVDAAGYHERVELCASTVRERVRIERPLTLAGAGIDRTVLDGGGGPGPVLELHAPVVIEGLTVTGGRGLDLGGRRVGGGVWIAATGGPVVLDQVAVRDNEADDGGGIAVVDGGGLWMDGGEISANTATADGGGLYVSVPATATLLGVRLADNVAGRGGGLWLDGVVGLDGVVVEGNRAGVGGGAHLEGPGASLLAPRSHLDRNAAGAGGGLHGQGTLRDAVVDGNDADRGGGVAADGPMTLLGVTLVGNHALLADGGGVSLAPGAPLIATGVTMLGNDAVGVGGGLHDDGAGFLLTDVRLQANTADRGAGIAISAAPCACDRVGIDVELRDNAARAAGGDLWAGGGETRLEGSTLTGATAPIGASVLLDGATLTLRDGRVDEARASDPDDAAVRLLDRAGTAIDAVDTVFEANVPTDLRLGDHPATAAPGATFVCDPEGC